MRDRRTDGRTNIPPTTSLCGGIIKPVWSRQHVLVNGNDLNRLKSYQYPITCRQNIITETNSFNMPRGVPLTCNSRYIDDIVVTGCIGSCHIDNILWSQWQNSAIRRHLHFSDGKHLQRDTWNIRTVLLYIRSCDWPSHSEVIQKAMGKIGHTALSYWGRVTHTCVSKLDHHWFRQWRVACSVPPHYLNHRWLIVNSWNNTYFQKNVVCKMSAILSQPQLAD